MEDNEEEVFDGNIPRHTGFGAFDDDAVMEEPEGEAVDDFPIDDLGQALCDAREDCESENQRMKFQQMLADHCKLLYPGCANGLWHHSGVATMEGNAWCIRQGIW
jgi:hypothetical protein